MSKQAKTNKQLLLRVLLTMCSWRKSPSPWVLSTRTKMASCCCVLKPTARRSARVLGRSLGAQVNVMRAPPFPKMYVVPAGRQTGSGTSG